MKSFLKAATLGLLLLTSPHASQAQTQNTGWDLQFLGANYNQTTNQTDFSYELQSDLCRFCTKLPFFVYNPDHNCTLVAYNQNVTDLPRYYDTHPTNSTSFLDLAGYRIPTLDLRVGSTSQHTFTFDGDFTDNATQDHALRSQALVQWGNVDLVTLPTPFCPPPPTPPALPRAEGYVYLDLDCDDQRNPTVDYPLRFNVTTEEVPTIPLGLPSSNITGYYNVPVPASDTPLAVHFVSDRPYDKWLIFTRYNNRNFSAILDRTEMVKYLADNKLKDKSFSYWNRRLLNCPNCRSQDINSRRIDLEECKKTLQDMGFNNARRTCQTYCLEIMIPLLLIMFWFFESIFTCFRPTLFPFPDNL